MTLLPTQRSITMKMTVNNIQIEVQDRGEGSPALVLLHYWGGSSRTWDAVIAALPAGHRTVVAELFKKSDSEAPAAGYALADFADDAQQMIATLGLRDYVLVGHSMGGKIAQLLASRRPAGLSGLVLVAPSPPTPLALPPQARAAMATAYLSRESVGMAIDHMLTAKPLVSGLREQVIADSLRGAPQARDAWPASTSGGTSAPKSARSMCRPSSSPASWTGWTRSPCCKPKYCRASPTPRCTCCPPPATCRRWNRPTAWPPSSASSCAPCQPAPAKQPPN